MGHPVKGEVSTISFSSEDLPERDRLPNWREVSGRTMMLVDMEPLTETPFRCDASISVMRGLAIGRLSTTPNRITRTQQLIVDGNDDLLFVIPEEGRLHTSTRRGNVTISPGQGLLMSSAEPSVNLVPSTATFISLAIPAATLIPLLADFDSALRGEAGVQTVPFRLLTVYLSQLIVDSAQLSSSLLQIAVTHLYDLVALSLGAANDAAAVAADRGVRAARLHALKVDVQAHLGSSALSLTEIAVRQGISSSYVRKLFDESGTSFTTYVLTARLERARRILCDPRARHLPISAVAYSVGFGDLSYFNRTFRRIYGMTPSDVRAQGRSERDR